MIVVVSGERFYSDLRSKFVGSGKFEKKSAHFYRIMFRNYQIVQRKIFRH